MAKKKYIVKEAYLAFAETNVYRGSKIELDASNPGTKKLLEMGAIELDKKEAVSGSDN
jgi:hypothetical protein